MPKIKIYNSQTGKESGELELKDVVFGVKPKESVVYQVYRALRANLREPWAHTKGKGEVRGGGRKPWKQKGTGRARHGSIRSPLWRGGGIIFGPRNLRNYKQKVNVKMKNLAVRMCLSDKVFAGRFIVVDELKTGGKTKEIVMMVSKLPMAGRRALLISPSYDLSLLKATRNMENIALQRAQDVNVVDIMHSQYIIATPEGVKALDTRLNK